MSKVSIITRTKDRPVFLARALESISGQVFTDFNLLIFNDGGDKLAVDSIVSRQPDNFQKKITVYHRPLPSNAPDTIFNEAIDKTKSEYFAIHDDDDTWHPEFLKITVEHLEKSKQLGATVVRTDRINEVVGTEGIRFKTKRHWMPDLKAINLYRQCIDNQFTPIATLFRRRAYEDVGRFDSTLPVVGDWEFGLRLLMHYDVDFIDPGFALANYHHRKKTGSSQDAISSNDKHRHYTNMVMNNYLRKELIEGRLGAGYIMSSLKYNQSYLSQVVRRVLPRFIADAMKKRVQN